MGGVSEYTRQEKAARAARREHDCIEEAMRVLEKALVAPTPGRETEWIKRAATALAVVTDDVRQHVESAEGDNGLVTEVEAKVGLTRDVRFARADHKRMVEDSELLLKELSEPAGGPGLAIAEVRHRTIDMTALLRQHEWREADLIMSVFDLDLGAGD
jgi:hypothetical protein